MTAPDNLHEETENTGEEQAREETVEAMAGDPEKMTRDDLLKTTGKLIAHLDKKSISGRMIDYDLEKARDSKTRLLIQAIQIHGSLLKDSELGDIKQQLSDLQTAITGRKPE